MRTMVFWFVTIAWRATSSNASGWTCKMHRPAHVSERFADAADAVREQDAGPVIAKHHRQIGREPRALPEQ